MEGHMPSKIRRQAWTKGPIQLEPSLYNVEYLKYNHANRFTVD